MSLSADDLQDIRTVIREEVRPIIREEVRPIVREEVRAAFDTDGRLIVRDEIDKRLSPLEGRVTALENDVKEIYFILRDMQSATAQASFFSPYLLE